MWSRWVEQRPIEEIAATIHATHEAVAALTYRARRALREALGPQSQCDHDGHGRVLQWSGCRFRLLTAHFEQLTAAVTHVSYDPALVEGGTIDFDTLTDETHAAWLRAAALVADQL